MKQKFFILTALGYLVLFSAFLYKPFAYTLRTLDPVTGKLKNKLEQSTATLQKGKGKNSAASVYNISGAKSTIRLMISETVFQSDSEQSTQGMNPADYIVLFKLSIEKNNRSFTMANDGTGTSMLSATFTDLGYGAYRIVPSTGLIPGEYAFIDRSTSTADGHFTVWTFGVD